MIQGRLLLGSKGGPHDAPIPEREFRARFGVSANVCFKIWELCENTFLRQNVHHKHLLWALLFLKTYTTEDILATMSGVTRKTFRFWTWLVVEVITKQKNNLVGSAYLFCMRYPKAYFVIGVADDGEFFILVLIYHVSVWLFLELAYYYARSDWRIGSEMTVVRHAR